MVAQLDQRPEAVGFSSLADVASIATRGPITPDHVIRTKAVPVVFDEEPEAAVKAFAEAYGAYFERNAGAARRQGAPRLTQLDAAPRWGVWPGYGTLAFDRSIGAAQITTDITQHTRRAIQVGEKLGGWKALEEADLFDMEYWELEQAKLGKSAQVVPFLTPPPPPPGVCCCFLHRSLVCGTRTPAVAVQCVDSPFAGARIWPGKQAPSRPPRPPERTGSVHSEDGTRRPRCVGRRGLAAARAARGCMNTPSGGAQGFVPRPTPA